MASASLPTDGIAGQQRIAPGDSFEHSFLGGTFTLAEDAPSARTATATGSPRPHRGAGCRSAHGSGRTP